MTNIEELLNHYSPIPSDLITMVNKQIVNRGIIDSNVISAFKSIDRKKFVGKRFKDIAYADRPLPIGYKQTISQPYVVAFMTEKLGLTKESRVLEIGTGCGYQTAILGKLVKVVYSIEVIPTLAKIAKENLKQFKLDNITIYNKNGREGLREKAPFSHIIVTAGSKDIPKALLEQLEINGKMIIPVGENELNQDIQLITKKKKDIEIEKILPVRFVPLV